MKPLFPFANPRIVSLALNLPGPLCASRLVGFGAEVVKIEPPDGDPMSAYSPAYYRSLHAGIEVRKVDLKQASGQAELAELLDGAALLLTAQRPAALGRLGLDSATLQKRWPHLSHLAIIGHPAAEADRAGHDLTYLAASGLLRPPELPQTLMVDLLGAERAVSEALVLLARALQSGRGERGEVALSDGVPVLEAPWRHGLTRPSGLLGGQHPGYQLYRTADGWLALAALEPRFAASLCKLLGLAELEYSALAQHFLRHPGAHWQALAARHDLPLALLPGQD